jgi:hypothetical protein
MQKLPASTRYQDTRFTINTLRLRKELLAFHNNERGWIAKPTTALPSTSIMNDKAAPNRAALQQFAQRQQEDSLRLLQQYVESRKKTFEVFSQLDPESKQAREAKALLEKAQADYEALAASIGALAASIGTTSDTGDADK